MCGIQNGRLALHKGTRCQSARSLKLGRARQEGWQERGTSSLQECQLLRRTGR